VFGGPLGWSSRRIVTLALACYFVWCLLNCGAGLAGAPARRMSRRGTGHVADPGSAGVPFRAQHDGAARFSYFFAWYLRLLVECLRPTSMWPTGAYPKSSDPAGRGAPSRRAFGRLALTVLANTSFNHARTTSVDVNPESGILLMCTAWRCPRRCRREARVIVNRFRDSQEGLRIMGDAA